MTRQAGRLTPAASVDVAVSTDAAPDLKATSTRLRSSLLSPAAHGGRQCIGVHIQTQVPLQQESAGCGQQAVLSALLTEATQRQAASGQHQLTYAAKAYTQLLDMAQ